MHILPTKKECLLFEGKHSLDMLLSLIFLSRLARVSKSYRAPRD